MDRIPESEWVWYGFPGHFILGARCQYHLCTRIGEVLVSTVGRLVEDPERAPHQISELGPGRYYETFVFRVDGENEHGDPNVLSWDAIDTEGYMASLEAEQGHRAMCEKWATLPQEVEEAT